MGSAPQGRLGIVSGTLAATRTIGQTAGIALLGALWAGRTLYYAGSALAAGATEASSEAQAAALQDTFLVTTALVAAALLLAVVAWLRGRNVRDLTAAEAGSSA